MVLAGKAFRTQAAECRAAAIAAVGVVVVGGQRVAGLVDKDAARLQVVLQQVEDAVIGAIAAAAHGIAFIIRGHLVGGAIFDELKDAGNVEGRHPTDRTLDAVWLVVRHYKSVRDY